MKNPVLNAIKILRSIIRSRISYVGTLKNTSPGQNLFAISKRAVFLLLVFFLMLKQATAQCDSVFFRYTGTLIRDVSLIDTSRIIAVGDNGYIIKSVDGGKSWRNIKNYTSYMLETVQMVTDKVGYAAGQYKTILKTEDEGETWFPLMANTRTLSQNISIAYRDIYFFDKDSGYIVGDDGMLVSTADGGKNWHQTDLYESGRFNSIQFFNNKVGFIGTGGPFFYKTVNAGQTWTKMQAAAISWNDYSGTLRFVDSLNGFLFVSGVCLKTTDGGTNWVQMPGSSNGPYSDVYFQDAQTGFVVSANGYIAKTTNGALSWDNITNYESRGGSLYCISADPSRKKIIAAGGGAGGEFLGYNGRNIISITNKGDSFEQLGSNTRTRYRDAFFMNDSTGYMVGDGGTIIKTSDFAETWRHVGYVPSLFGNSNVGKILFVDSLHGFAYTDDIYKTADGGKSWAKTATPGGYNQYNARQMYFFDTLNGLVQDNYTIYNTKDGGNTWTNVRDVSASTFYTDFTALPNGNAFAVGYGGRMDVSTDSGRTWSVYNLKTDKYLTSVYFCNNQVGYIGTGDATLFKTTDGGKNWTAISTGISPWQIRSIRFVNDSMGYMIGNYNDGGTSRIYKTKNGGLSWSLEKEELENLSKIAGFNKLYIGGGNGLILRMDSLVKPSMPGYIAGPVKTCINDISTFTTGGMEGVTYHWALSSGGTNKYGGNLDTVAWNSAGTHMLNMWVSNGCGVSPQRQLAIDAELFEPTITVQDSLLTATEGLNYQWYLNGETIPAYQDGKSKSMVAFAPGDYTAAVKSYGCTVTTPAVAIVVPLRVSICPDGGAYLTVSTSSNTYQWQRDDGSGFKNISNGVNYSGTTTSLLGLKNIPSSWYGYRFRCITDNDTSIIYSLRFQNVWIGLNDGAWENAANWLCGKVPDANTDVSVSVGSVIINSNVTVRQLLVQYEAKVTVNPGNTLTITP